MLLLLFTYSPLRNQYQPLAFAPVPVCLDCGFRMLTSRGMPCRAIWWQNYVHHIWYMIWYDIYLFWPRDSSLSKKNFRKYSDDLSIRSFSGFFRLYFYALVMVRTASARWTLLFISHCLCKPSPSLLSSCKHQWWGVSLPSYVCWGCPIPSFPIVYHRVVCIYVSLVVYVSTFHKIYTDWDKSWPICRMISQGK